MTALRACLLVVLALIGVVCSTHVQPPMAYDTIFVVVLGEDELPIANVGIWAGNFAGMSVDGRMVLRSSRPTVVWAFKPDYAVAWRLCNYGICALRLRKLAEAN